MHQFTKIASLLLIAAVISDTTAIPAKMTENGLSKFSTDLYQKCAESSGENIIMSPFSVASALAFLAQGTEGKTFDEIATGLYMAKDKSVMASEFLELSNVFQQSNEIASLNTANRIYVQQGAKISDKFNEVAKTKFHAGAEEIDFAKSVESANKINQWVENNTNSKIKDLVQPKSLEMAQLVLINAIHFKAFWRHQFYDGMTEPGKFFINDKDTVDAQYMHKKKGLDYAILDELDATAVKLPYMAQDMSFVVILPNKREGLSELEGKLKDFDMTTITEKMSEAEVDVTLPKFKFEYKISLKEVLKKMGMSEMFSNDADLSGLFESKQQLAVSDVIHKAFIEVNEEGTEAAAATFVGVVGSSFVEYSKTYTFTVDHPFLFSINHGSSSLFMGRVNKL